MEGFSKNFPVGKERERMASSVFYEQKAILQ